MMGEERELAASTSVGGKLYGELRQERARAEAAERRLRDVEEALELHFEKIIEVWWRGTDDLAEAIGLSRSEYAAFVEKRETPLQLILKRARTTSTKEAG